MRIVVLLLVALSLIFAQLQKPKQVTTACGYPIYVEPGTHVGLVTIDICADDALLSASTAAINVYQYQTADFTEINPPKLVFRAPCGLFRLASNYGEIKIEIDTPGLYGFEIYRSGAGYQQTVYLEP